MKRWDGEGKNPMLTLNGNAFKVDGTFNKRRKTDAVKQQKLLVVSNAHGFGSKVNLPLSLLANFNFSKPFGIYGGNLAIMS